MHIAVLWKAVEFEFWNHFYLHWKSMGKVKCNLKLCPSWNKLKKWNFQFKSFLNKFYHLAWDDVYLSHMHLVVLLFFSGEFAVAAEITFPRHQVSQRKISKNIISRNEKSIKSDLWILMRNIFWGTLYNNEKMKNIVLL